MPESLPTLRIDIISDVVCPWCVIGYRHLERAMADFQDRTRFELRWQPFELNPGLPPGGEALREHLARKYGAPPEAGAAARERLVALGREVGFEFDYFEGMRIYNTFDAHKLLHWARNSGHQTPLQMALFSAFFQHRQVIEDHAVLAECAATAGLDREAALRVLASSDSDSAVRECQSEWLDRFISGVPTFVFDGGAMLTGAQPAEILAEAIAAALARRRAAAAE